MKLLKIAIVLVAGTVFLSTTCKDENCHDTIRIINNSENAIYFESSFWYPDTALVDNTISGDSYKKVAGCSTGKLSHRGCFDGEINGSRSEKLMIYIFDAYTYETTSWDTIVKYYMVLKRYDLTLDDLTNMGWAVTYP